MKNILLFAPIEGSGKDLNSLNYKMDRDFEAEAIKCFKCWRQNAGEFKNIDILTICPTDNDISEYCLNEFKQLNVKHVHINLVPSTVKCGFWNIPIVGKYVEEIYKEYDFFI